MAKFHGVIGFLITSETSPGVFTGTPTEREYFGDLIKESKQWTDTNRINSNLTLRHRLSIISDDFAETNVSTLRYCKIEGTYWSITNVEIQRPRLILSVGEVYNGPKL